MAHPAARQRENAPAPEAFVPDTGKFHLRLPDTVREIMRDPRTGAVDITMSTVYALLERKYRHSAEDYRAFALPYSLIEKELGLSQHLARKALDVLEAAGLFRSWVSRQPFRSGKSKGEAPLRHYVLHPEVLGSYLRRKLAWPTQAEIDAFWAARATYRDEKRAVSSDSKSAARRQVSTALGEALMDYAVARMAPEHRPAHWVERRKGPGLPFPDRPVAVPLRAMGEPVDLVEVPAATPPVDTAPHAPAARAPEPTPPSRLRITR